MTTHPDDGGGTARIEPVDLAKVMDEVSLEQALIDVEIATARVADLTSRLVAARSEVADAKAELASVEALRAENDDLRAQLEAIHRSRGYMVVKGLRRLRPSGS